MAAKHCEDAHSVNDSSEARRRERLLQAIVRVSFEHGYEGTTIARVIAAAGVSRPTFYTYFADRADCFLAALEDVQRRAAAAVALAVERQPPQDAAAATTKALVAFAQEQPMPARLLMSEAMAAGGRALDAHDRGVEAIAWVIERRHREVTAEVAVPALAGEVLVATVYRLLATRLRRGEQPSADLLAELLEWVEGYGRRAPEQRWRTLSPVPARAGTPPARQAPLRPPPPLAPGRPRRSAGDVAENHRLRIIFATAEVVCEHGYGAATVAEITRAAGVDGRAFYRLFRGKHDAFTAVHELVFQNAMAACAGAFFARGEWPRRMWQAARALAQYVGQNATLTRASIVEGHAGGAASVERLQALLAGFTIFLQEGYQHQPPGARAPSPLALEAIAEACFEVLYRQARGNAGLELAGIAAHCTYISLAPFVGAARAAALVEEMLENGPER
ncbi:MAG TPA: TetR/AcrR family transcriptional regulator [Solirubrobacteraceae bacterium]|jgi:AcrR family transcriptional regulator|nr:TetR/AcrR family transcriptional regulator [Solirubrobacteraceae bacterium]